MHLRERGGTYRLGCLCWRTLLPGRPVPPEAPPDKRPLYRRTLSWSLRSSSTKGSGARSGCVRENSVPAS